MGVRARLGLFAGGENGSLQMKQVGETLNESLLKHSLVCTHAKDCVAPRLVNRISMDQIMEEGVLELPAGR